MVNLRRWTWPAWTRGRHWKQLVVGVPVLVPCLVLSVFVVRGCASADVPLVHPRTDVSVPLQPATSAPSDLTGVQLAAVDGTTVPSEVRGTGTAHLNGRVNGPQGPLAGAVVRVEHLVSKEPPHLDVVSAADGTWDLPGIAGGPYRVRAFLAPSFAQLEPEVLFLPDGQQQSIDLVVDAFSGISVLPAVAPDPPQLNRPTSVALRVTRRTVDGEGVVRADPVVNASVTLTATPGWSVDGPSAATTSLDGDAVFTLECRSVGASQVQAVVRPTPAEPPQPVTADVSPCTDPNATTTTAPASGGPPTSTGSQPPN
jgi:hypothetical protein